ncbi:hypothetical protein ACU635_30325 [[Actinomadura] parvosata]|uniref:hypothetical protein n=1 Tax=[Actinomadura] parvosata TaxID=1955412 RepID=UPI00406CF9DA
MIALPGSGRRRGASARVPAADTSVTFMARPGLLGRAGLGAAAVRAGAAEC